MSSSFAAAFGRAVAAERSFRGLSQAELGDRLGWSRSTISAIETGVRPVAVGDLPEICTALECSVLTLMARAGDRDKRALQI
jgi:transcriptional regulator with XRE-family HTH domain